ncbi:hypothetical protein HH310_19030 [Actinoplanes sp. TBRC 11911]|uniref:PilW family protein n=1 Tax=Actinoplanes sp. TBRC 11911 TaxID=2729386 RepID=UPI00145CF14A|nr:hypothetical protein [Actinoplanes sp. TBRC 11911]NMO53278.1 hypothetical protein [Actinoplanes sp. TBRC 11911]
MRGLRRRLMSGDDSGYSLVDIMVATAVLSVLMVATMAAVTEIYSTVTRTVNTSFARDQVNNSFRRLDKDLRYANYVASPVSSASATGTAYSMVYAVPPATAAGETCRELSYDSGTRVLSWRKWNPTGTKPALSPFAGNLRLIGGTTAPFTLIPPDSTVYGSITTGASGLGKDFSPDYFQVRVQFNASVGKVVLPLDVVFTAQNMSGVSPTSSSC